MQGSTPLTPLFRHSSRSAKVNGSVTSISFDADNHFLAGTAHSNIYSVNTEKFTPELVSTCHYACVNDVEFPSGSSDLFATASDSDIRIWNANTKAELLRISVPNLECKCITFKKDGSSIITGWNDGKIRAFGPQSGRLQYVINDAHKPVVTALAVTEAFNSHGDFRIVSGGEGLLVFFCVLLFLIIFSKHFILYRW